MPLSCSCEYSGDYGDDFIWHHLPNDYSMYDKKRGRRCISCKSVIIRRGDLCAEFERERSVNTDIEEKIYGDSVPLASVFLCEHCADIYFSLEELGFECIFPDENMNELLKEYHALVKDRKKER